MKNTHRRAPLRFARFTALGLAFAWGIIAFGIGINALVKSNDLKDNVKRLVPPPTVVNINDHDVFSAGAVATVISIVIAVLCILFILADLVMTTTPGILKIEGSVLGFFTTWLFATIIPVTHFYRTRSAKIEASINGTPLSQQSIQTVSQALGLSSRYRDLFFLRLLAILPWFTFLFTLIATVVLFMAAGRGASETSTIPSEGSPRGTEDATGMSEKPATSTNAGETSA